MKNRFLTIITAVLMLFSLSVNVAATKDPVSTSSSEYTLEILDNYNEIKINGVSYYSVRYDYIYFDYDEEYEFAENESINIVGEYKDEIISASLGIYDNVNADLSVDLLNGQYKQYTYISEEYLEEYNEIIYGHSHNCTIDFVWPEGNTVKADIQDLIANEPVYVSDSINGEFFSINSCFDGTSVYVSIGQLIIMDDKYYYWDYTDNRENNATRESVLAYPITDEELLEEIKEAEQLYYESDIGFLYNDDLSNSIAKPFFTIFFAIIPFVILIVSFILIFRLHKKYRKLLILLSSLSLIEIIVFIVLSALLF